MKDRLLEFLKIENKSSAQFAEEIGVQPSGISHILSGRNNPSLDFVVKMLNKYPALSTDWLLFGKGKMYKDAELNGLFDVQHSEDETDKIKTPEKESFLTKSVNTDSDTDILKEFQANPKTKRTKRIVCFFEDQTFKEYFLGD